ncbi:MAG: hypothetical protein ACC642_09025, partial [Pseudomonadales bacterium]
MVSFATGLGLLLLWSIGRDEEQRVDHFGSTLTAALASQVIEPLIAEDLIHLGVLANRIIELPEVIGTTVYTVDNKMLAISGDVQRGRPFTQAVVLDDAIVGYVRLQIDEALFREGLPTLHLVVSLLLMLFFPALALLFNQTRHSRRAIKFPATVEIKEPQSPDPHYLVTLNLFNQLSLPPDECKTELALARQLATAVADLYQGEVLDLSGTGLLISFDTTDSDDRPFHVICAASALSQLLANTDSRGRYRLSAHRILLNEGEPLDLDADEVADAAVLSALARDNTLAISGALFDEVPFAQRLDSERMNNPLLEELESISGCAYLLH